VTRPWHRAAAVGCVVVALAAGCSSGGKEHASTTSTTRRSTVSLDDAVRVVQRSAPDLPADQASPLLRAWCAAARAGDRTPLVSKLQALPASSEPVLDEVLGALQQGANQYCPDDAAKAPDLLSRTYDDMTASTTTTAAAAATNDPPSSSRGVRTAAAPTTTTVHRTSAAATTAAPATTAATSSTTSTTDPCANIGNSTSGVMVGNGGASSCSHSTGH
jgi:hypothetical protein